VTHEEVAEAYDRYGHLVFRRCQRILRNHAAADDALQEVYVRLWRYGDAFRHAESKVSWLYRVAERCCFDQLARLRSRAESPLEEFRESSSPAPSHAETIADRDVVMRFLDRFDERVKQVAILHYLDELTQEEISAATGWSRPTVRKKITYLKEQADRLRARLQGEGSAP
jgi:RNA polymerase sigma-70 factor (ECF subfamily)